MTSIRYPPSRQKRIMAENHDKLYYYSNRNHKNSKTLRLQKVQKFQKSPKISTKEIQKNPKK